MKEHPKDSAFCAEEGVDCLEQLGLRFEEEMFLCTVEDKIKAVFLYVDLLPQTLFNIDIAGSEFCGGLSHMIVNAVSDKNDAVLAVCPVAW